MPIVGCFPTLLLKSFPIKLLNCFAKSTIGISINSIRWLPSAVLGLGNAPAVAPLCADASTIDLFLYFWNLYVLWFAWNGEQANSFATFQCAEVAGAVIASLYERLRKHQPTEEAYRLIALIGVASFLGMSLRREREVEVFLSKQPRFDRLMERADEKTFVPAIFFLLGLNWLHQGRRRVPARVWQEQLEKADDYAETTAALERLKLSLRRFLG